MVLRLVRVAARTSRTRRGPGVKGQDRTSRPVTQDVTYAWADNFFQDGSNEMRILVVDDEAGIRKALLLMLEDAGFEVAEAGNGEEGLRAFRRQPADLVITDLFMPDKDGLELIRGLRREFPDVKVIAMSGGGFSSSMHMLPFARRLGAVEVLDKPFSLATALATVERVLNTLAAA